MKVLGKTLSVLICVLLLVSVFSAEAALPPPPPPPPDSSFNVVNQTVRGDISHTIQGKGGIIEVVITGNTVDGNIFLNIIDNKDVKKIIVVVSKNVVYQEVRINIFNNALDKPSSEDIKTEVAENKVGKSLTLVISDNFVMQDIITDVLENLVGGDLVVSIGAGDIASAYGNLVSSIETDITNNTVCNIIRIFENENTIDVTLATVVTGNRASNNIDIDISYNAYPKNFQYLFTGLTVTIKDNHVVYEDISILIIKNELALVGFPIIWIDILENGAGRNIFININKNQAPPGIFNLNIKDNAADGIMAAFVQGNIAALILITIKDNFAYTGKPQIFSQKPATILNNINKDLQAEGADTDGDGLSDKFEKRIIGTNPGNTDTDDDGLFDGWDDITKDKKADFGGGGIIEEGFGEFGDPRQKNQGSGQRQNGGSISTLFNQKKENPSPICQDIYVEVDWMPSHKPSRAAFKMVVDAFAQHRIHIHIDSGWARGTASNRVGGERLPKVDLIRLNSRPAGSNNDFYDFKENNFDTRRDLIFHYAIYGIKFQEIPATTGAVPSTLTSGFVQGDDFFISDANVVSFAKTLKADKKTARAGILMHELGHNLGLLHSNYSTSYDQTTFDGIDNDTTFSLHPSYNATAFINYKSVMNYRYALTGPIDYSDGKHGKNDFDDWSAINLRRVVDWP
jgi:hypothetical protein